MSLPTSAGLVSDADHVELSRLLGEIAWRLDNHRAGTVYELTTEDVEFHVGPEPVVGHDALKTWGEQFDQADPLPGIRHSLSNARFSADGPDRAVGTSMLTAYFVPIDSNESAEAGDVIVATAPFAVGEDHDTFVRTPEGWRIASRRWEQLFTR